MGLSHLKTHVAKIESPGGTFDVRGLSFEDIVPIVQANAATLGRLFEQIKVSATGEFSLDDTVGIMTTLATTAPTVAAEIIAVAADDPDLIDIARKLPFPVQIDALEQIAKLTFSTEGSIKKVVEMIIRVAQAAQKAIQMGLKA